MRASMLLPVFVLAFGLAVCSFARADTAEASCEVRKEGDKQKGRSGPCTFSQRQGYIDIDLRNGDTISLSPVGNGNQYRDQSGKKVTRTSAGATGMSFKWEGGRHILVTWTGDRTGAYGYGSSSAHRGGEYQRGYDDGRRGSWDRDSHNQDYKDGFAAGEASRSNGGGGYGGSGSKEYGVNRLDDGAFEIVWSNPFCSVTFDRGEIRRVSDECTAQQIDRSKEAARRER